MKTHNKGFAPFTVILTIVAILIVGGIAYYAGTMKNTVQLPADTNEQTTPLSTTLPSPYISAQENWPPVIITAATTYSCTAATNEMGSTVERLINNKTFCITTLTEGAAGSSYSTYTYTSANTNTSVKTTTFTLRYQNCGNYAALSEYPLCQNAQASFALDAIVASQF
jgi:hypothetical protein